MRSANVTTVLGSGFGCGHLVVKSSEPPGSGLGPSRGPLSPSGKRGWGGGARLTELVTDTTTTDGIIIMLSNASRTLAKVPGAAVSPPCG